jgi:hypothetical protein
MLITQKIKTLTGGVTQQSITDRSPNQLTAQTNCINSLVSGLRTRQATWLNAVLATEGDEDLPNSHKHQVNRDALEKYLMYVNADNVSVFDKISGNKYPLEIEDDAENYLKILSDVNPVDAFRTITSADTTYLLNKTQPVYRELRDIDYVAEDTTRHQFKLIALWGNRNQGGSYEFSSGTETVTSSIEQGLAVASANLQSLLDSVTDDTYTTTRVGSSVYLDVPTSGSVPTVVNDSYVWRLQPSGTNKVYLNILTVSEVSVIEPLDELSRTYLIHVTQADYSVKYSVSVGNSTVTHTTPEATTDRARAGLSIENIHDELSSAINGLSDASAISTGSYVEIVTSEAVDVSVEDDLNNFSLKIVGKTVALFTDLPLKAPNDYRAKVTGELGDESLGYWVAYNESRNAWVESRHPNEVHGIDKATMPHILVRLNKASYADSANPLGIYFKLSQGNWSDRLYGDDAATPFPTFVSEWDNVNNVPILERTINAMTFHRNRLVFSSDENITMSESAIFNNFFRTTAEALKDSDPIDIGVLSTEINPIEAMLSAQKELILYGSKTQYSLRSGDTLSANTVFADPLSSYSVDGLAAPLFAGDMVFFLVKRNGYSGIFMSAINEQQNSAVEITSHVPTFIKGKPLRMTVSTTESRLFVQTDDDVRAVYVYDYKVVNRENVHSAWSLWKFDDEVVDLHVEDSLLSVITKTDNTYYSEFMTLDADYGEDDYGYKLALDRIRPYVDGEDIPTGERVVALPYGTVIGKPISMSFKMSPIFMRDKERETVIDGRLQVKKASLSVKDTQKFDIKVIRKGRSEGNNNMSSRTVGQTGITLSEPTLVSKVFSANVDGNTKTTEILISSDASYISSFQRLIWTGRYTRRQRSV